MVYDLHIGWHLVKARVVVATQAFILDVEGFEAGQSFVRVVSRYIIFASQSWESWVDEAER